MFVHRSETMFMRFQKDIHGIQKMLSLGLKKRSPFKNMFKYFRFAIKRIFNSFLF
jgi:hypothetical protein